MKRFWLAWPLSVLIATLGQACSGPDIPLATLPPSDAATPHVCTSKNDCPEHFYCEKATCDASTGTCQPVPTSCDDVESPVCGCDGVTYFDDCLRKANSVASSTQRQCGFDSALPCGGPSGARCPAGTFCAQFTFRPPGPPGPCPPDVPGFCWALPSACPEATGMMGWDSCSSMQLCLDTCTAIRQGGAYRHSFMCP
jgi:Kazal-type serine protease inhibitor domain